MADPNKAPEPNYVQEVAALARRVEVAIGVMREGEYQDAAPFIILRDSVGNERVEPITCRREPPRRKTGIIVLNDADSFVRFHQEHAKGEPPQNIASAFVYAAMTPKVRFVAVLNDHTNKGPGYRDFRAVFEPTHSVEWAEWTGNSGQQKAFAGNEAFALFVEANAMDIVKPDAAKMLQIALNFKVRQNVSFGTAMRLEDGNIDFQYSNVVQGSATPASGGKMQIPSDFTIRIPVFDGPDAPKYDIKARFRYRLADGRLSIWYELIHPAKVQEAAFTAMWKAIEKGTKEKIYYGSPG